MEICNKEKIIDLASKGFIKYKNIENLEENFLDDLRFGLRLNQQMLEVNGPVDISKKISTSQKCINVAYSTLRPGRLYLGTSVEQLSLPRNIIGIIYTRSKYARIGLELLKSSSIIIPGFGNDNPTSIVFEITVPYKISNFDLSEMYSFVLFFQLNKEISNFKNNYYNKFPLPILEQINNTESI